VLSEGDWVDPEQIGPAPNNAIIVKRAPQLELLKRTSVCVTDAGLNTVLESLAQLSAYPWHAICSFVLPSPKDAFIMRFRLLARLETTLTQWQLPRCLVRLAHRRARDVRR
jgi:hypothetical protein